MEAASYLRGQIIASPEKMYDQARSNRLQQQINNSNRTFG
jgi:hypothetical protein